MCYISLTSFTTPTTHEDKVIQKLIRNPPNHTYLPPMPVLAPPLLCRKSLDKAATDGKVLVSVDSLTPYDICVGLTYTSHTVTHSHSHTITPSHITPSHTHTLIQSHTHNSHIITPSHITPSHTHTLILSHTHRIWYLSTSTPNQ